MTLHRAWYQTLAVAIAVCLAAAGGVTLARLGPPEAVVLAEEAPVLDLASEVDLDPLVRTGTQLVAALSAELPVPLPAPRNPREATPLVRHGLLEIPSIGLSQPLFEGVSLTAIDRGPSHWPGTALPGELGNMVIAGHRTTKTRPFWDLDLVQPGDELVITMESGERHVYALDRVEVVDASALYIVDQSYGYRATLFGCHPKGSARQRIVGHFTLVSSTPAPPPPAPAAPPVAA